MPPALQLPDDKAFARRVIRANRRDRATAVDAASRELLAERVRDHFAALFAALPPGSVVASFESRPTEVPTHLLNDDVRRRGLDLIVPFTLPDLDLDWVRPGSERRLGLDRISTASLVVVPALAVAVDGMRLGQGGGSYDRALARVSQNIPVVALVFDEELTARVPTQAHDRPVHGVVTPDAGHQTFAAWRETDLKN